MARLTFDEILAKTDNVTRIVADAQGIIRVAQKAQRPNSPGGRKVTPAEVKEIKDKAQEAIDELQGLVDELIEDLQD